MRTRQVLMETLNKSPRPECVIQNQILLLEVLLDIRDMLYSKQDNGFVAPWENLKHSSEPANEEKDDSTVAPWEEAGLIFHKKEPGQKPLKPKDEPI